MTIQEAVARIMALRRYTAETSFATTRTQNDIIQSFTGVELADLLRELQGSTTNVEEDFKRLISNACRRIYVAVQRKGVQTKAELQRESNARNCLGGLSAWDAAFADMLNRGVIAKMPYTSNRGCELYGVPNMFWSKSKQQWLPETLLEDAHVA
jgi:hypothetical protein